MTLLLDTHYVFGLAGSPGKLTERERAFLRSYPQRFVVSAVSIWEIRLKWRALHRSGDRKGPAGPHQILRALAGLVDYLDLSPVHAALQLDEPTIHNDPFDELLLAQVQAEGLKLLSRDRALTNHTLVTSVP